MRWFRLRGAKTELPQRQRILRRIYEDNLRLAEPGHYSPPRPQRPSLATWGATVAIALLVAALGLLDHVLVRSSPKPSITSTSTPTITPAFDEPLAASPLTIMLDPGHGGSDSGALGKAGTREKDVTLDLARRLEEKLNADTRYRAYLVRDSDTSMALNDRVAFVNSRDTHLFVSIQVNNLPNPVKAFQTYYFGSCEEADTQMLTRRANRDWSYTIEEFERLGADIKFNLNRDESRALAESMQISLDRSRLQESRGIANGRCATAPFVVLLGVKAPSALVEITGLGNEEQERRLGEDQYRDRIATALATGITEYLNDQSKRRKVQYVKGKDGNAEQ